MLQKRRGRRQARPVGRLVSQALASLGVAPAPVTAALQAAWDRAAEPRWRHLATPTRLQGGQLEVAVSSASMREELAQFHAVRLLKVLQAALPTLPLVGLRFVAGTSGATR